MQIRNHADLIQHGKTPTDREARKWLLDTIESVLQKVAPENLIGSHVEFSNRAIYAGDLHIKTDEFKRIFVVGGGKAGSGMAAALEKFMGSSITSGIVSVPPDCIIDLEKIQLNPASHPEPDENGMRGAIEMMKLAHSATAQDMVVCLLSGGGSSLLPLPVFGISLEEKKMLTRQLLECGASINEINAVRKHISAIKGGNLARAAYPARLINLIISDVIGDPLDVIASGPTVADTSTFAQAIRILEHYDLSNIVPASIINHLSAGTNGQISENPTKGDVCFDRVSNLVIANNSLAVGFAGESLAGCGCQIKTGSAALTCSSIEAAKKIIDDCGNFRSAIPCAIVSGGETRVKVSGSGKGGRAQELALAFAVEAQRTRFSKFVFAAFATDGIDGPTDAAGAIIDHNTIDFGQRLGFKPEAFLNSHDSYNYFKQTDCLIKTGYTGTNVNDLFIALFY
ncbi:MAG: glycerate kinase type-2 family protein [Candidatus Rifleibacteriota bacterium]